LERDRRIDVTFLLGGLGLAAAQPPRPAWATRAAKLPADLPVKPPPTMAGYSRERFGPPWKDTDRNGCGELVAPASHEQPQDAREREISE
jgi:hypothetical protein